MKNYFIDYEIYVNNVANSWGNFLVSSPQTDVSKLASEIKELIIKEFEKNDSIEHCNIRFRQFNTL